MCTEGWLVPKHPSIRDVEDRFIRHVSESFEECFYGPIALFNDQPKHDHTKLKHFSLTGEALPGPDKDLGEQDLLHIKFSNPGPQYLYLLGSAKMDIYQANDE